MGSNYGFGTTVPLSYEEAVQRVRDALKAEGFGVITEIDMRQVLHEKLGIEKEPYLILGACNPTLAARALELEPGIGLLLPCNVVVRASDAGSRVEVADPQTLLGQLGNEQLAAIAEQAKNRLQRVVAAVEQ
jgi:uncharacterized protein (DUF302 family)